MRLKLTFLLLALNVALLGVLLYFEKVQSTQHLLDNASRFVLDPKFIQTLDHVHIHSIHASDPWELAKADDAWLVSSPVRWKANPYAIQQLLFQLGRLSWESRFSVADLAASSQDLGSYNLADPPIRITLHSGEASLVLSLGSPTEIGNRLYLLSPDGESIYVVARGLFDFLERDLDAFLDRRIFSLSGQETRAMQIQDRAASNVRVRLERSQDRWRLVSPIEAPADSARVGAFLADWEFMEVGGFEKGNGLSAAMDGRSIRLTLEGMNRRETLILAAPDEGGGGYYLGRREAYPAVFKVDAALVNELRSVQEEFREKRVLVNFQKEWTSMDIQFGAMDLRIQQLEGGSWQVLDTDGAGHLRTQPASEEAVRQVKEMLNQLEAQRFITDAPSEGDLLRYGLTDPQRRVILKSGQQDSVELRIGGVIQDGSETLLYANTTLSDSVFLVRPHVLASLSLDPFAYRERTIRRLPDSARISSLDLIHRASGLPIPLKQLADTEGPSLEESLRAFVKTTQVERFLNQPFSDPQLLNDGSELSWPYLLEARVRYSPESTGPDGALRLFISERLGGTTQYVGDPESQLVGTLSIELIESLDPYLARYPETPDEFPVEEGEAMEELSPSTP